MKFRHPVEECKLAPKNFKPVNKVLPGEDLQVKVDAVVDIKLVVAPSLTKNASGTCAIEMKQTQQGGDDSGLAQTPRATAANDNKVVEASNSPHAHKTNATSSAG